MAAMDVTTKLVVIQKDLAIFDCGGGLFSVLDVAVGGWSCQKLKPAFLNNKQSRVQNLADFAPVPPCSFI